MSEKKSEGKIINIQDHLRKSDEVGPVSKKLEKVRKITHAALVGEVEAFSKERELNGGQGFDFSSGHFYPDRLLDPTINTESPEAKIIHFVQTKVENDAFRNETKEVLKLFEYLKDMSRIVGIPMLAGLAFFVLTTQNEMVNPVDAWPLFAGLVVPMLVIEAHYIKLKRDAKHASPELLQAWEELRDELQNQIRVVERP